MSSTDTELDDQKMDEVLKGYNIPTQPKVMIDVMDECRKKEPNLIRIADIISRDVGLASAVLKTINSPFFGMRRKVESINQAVMLLGMKNVANLVTSYSMRQSINGKCAISLERFWDTATDVANISAALARKLSIDVTADEAYLLGLFIDCGIPILATKFEDYKTVLIEGNAAPDKEMTEIEDQHYSTNHAIIGYYTSRSWGLAEPVRQAILRHHDIDTLYQNDGDDESMRRDHLIAIQKMAENIAHTSRHLSEHHEWERVEQQTLDFIGIIQSEYDDMKEDIQEMLASE